MARSPVSRHACSTSIRPGISSRRRTVRAFSQLGETKYGKPILDRALNDATSLDEAAKLSLLSFDATMRSNLSVDAPIDLLRYRADSFSARNFATLEKDDPYWMALRKHYAEGLSSLVASIPPPPNLA